MKTLIPSLNVNVVEVCTKIVEIIKFWEIEYVRLNAKKETSKIAKKSSIDSNYILIIFFLELNVIPKVLKIKKTKRLCLITNTKKQAVKPIKIEHKKVANTKKSAKTKTTVQTKKMSHKNYKIPPPSFEVTETTTLSSVSEARNENATSFTKEVIETEMLSSCKSDGISKKKCIIDLTLFKEVEITRNNKIDKRK